MNDSVFFVDSPELVRQGLNSRRIDLKIKPNFSGIKDTLEWAWWEDYSFLKLGADLTLYYFSSEGIAQELTRPPPAGGQPNLADNTLFNPVSVDFFKLNVFYSGFFENTFELASLAIVTGIRTSYLQINQEIAYDPRFLISYEFDWDMTLSASYGLYTSYPQINFFLF